MTWPTKKIPELSPKSIGIIGLFCGSLGAIISVLSFTTGDGRQTSISSGIDYHVALVSDFGFKLGFFFIIFGFVLQIIEKVYDSNEKKVEVYILIITALLVSTVVYLLGPIITRLLFI